MKHHRTIEQVLEDYPKELILKDGTGATLRPLREGDEKALRKMYAGFPEDELWFLELDLSHEGVFERWIENLKKTPLVSVVAMVEGRIIGDAVLLMKAHGAETHLGRIRISVAPSYRELRLGTWMLLDLVNAAIALGLEMLEMDLVEDRDAAVIDGVGKIGFEESAVVKDHFRDRQGEPHGLVIMTKALPVEWGDF